MTISVKNRKKHNRIKNQGPIIGWYQSQVIDYEVSRSAMGTLGSVWGTVGGHKWPKMSPKNLLLKMKWQKINQIHYQNLYVVVVVVVFINLFVVVVVFVVVEVMIYVESGYIIKLPNGRITFVLWVPCSKSWFSL